MQWKLNHYCNPSQSGTIVCGGGQLCIDVVEVPKRLHNGSGQGVKNIPEKAKEIKQSNVLTKLQISQTKTVDNEGSLWGTLWMSNNRLILNVSDPDNNISSHSTLRKMNNSLEQNNKKSEGKVEMWGTPCSLTMPGKSNQLESWGTLWIHHNGGKQVGGLIKICLKTNP